jgi:hypothetical protein
MTALLTAGGAAGFLGHELIKPAPDLQPVATLSSEQTPTVEVRETSVAEVGKEPKSEILTVSAFQPENVVTSVEVGVFHKVPVPAVAYFRPSFLPAIVTVWDDLPGKSTNGERFNRDQAGKPKVLGIVAGKDGNLFTTYDFDDLKDQPESTAFLIDAGGRGFGEADRSFISTSSLGSFENGRAVLWVAVPNEDGSLPVSSQEFLNVEDPNTAPLRYLKAKLVDTDDSHEVVCFDGPNTSQIVGRGNNWSVNDDIRVLAVVNDSNLEEGDSSVWFVVENLTPTAANRTAFIKSENIRLLPGQIGKLPVFQVDTSVPEQALDISSPPKDYFIGDLSSPEAQSYKIAAEELLWPDSPLQGTISLPQILPVLDGETSLQPEATLTPVSPTATVAEDEPKQATAPAPIFNSEKVVTEVETEVFHKVPVPAVAYFQPSFTPERVTVWNDLPGKSRRGREFNRDMAEKPSVIGIVISKNGDWSDPSDPAHFLIETDRGFGDAKRAFIPRFNLALQPEKGRVVWWVAVPNEDGSLLVNSQEFLNVEDPNTAPLRYLKAELIADNVSQEVVCYSGPNISQNIGQRWSVNDNDIEVLAVVDDARTEIGEIGVWFVVRNLTPGVANKISFIKQENIRLLPGQIGKLPVFQVNTSKPEQAIDLHLPSKPIFIGDLPSQIPENAIVAEELLGFEESLQGTIRLPQTLPVSDEETSLQPEATLTPEIIITPESIQPYDFNSWVEQKVGFFNLKAKKVLTSTWWASRKDGWQYLYKNGELPGKSEGERFSSSSSLILTDPEVVGFVVYSNKWSRLNNADVLVNCNAGLEIETEDGIKEKRGYIKGRELFLGTDSFKTHVWVATTTEDGDLGDNKFFQVQGPDKVAEMFLEAKLVNDNGEVFVYSRPDLKTGQFNFSLAAETKVKVLAAVQNGDNSAKNVYDEDRLWFLVEIPKTFFRFAFIRAEDVEFMSGQMAVILFFQGTIENNLLLLSSPENPLPTPQPPTSILSKEK